MRFCEHCGTELVRICLRCGNALSPIVKFWGEGGAPVGGPHSLSEPAPTRVSAPPIQYTSSDIATRIVAERADQEALCEPLVNARLSPRCSPTWPLRWHSFRISISKMLAG
nr:hypothetical protein [Paraburkholderia pallida]